MDITLSITIMDGDEPVIKQDIIHLSKSFHPDELIGLSLAESKQLLKTLQQQIAYGNIKTFAKKLDEFHTYIDNNSSMIPNYGEKWRCSETVTAAFVESTVNEVVAKRMGKKQQMQWSPEGAHNLLQTRTATLNGELNQYFERWYPGFPVANDVNHDLHDVKLAA